MKRILIIILSLCLILGLSACNQKGIDGQNVKMEERILMVNDKLYYGTSETGPMGDAESVDGKILSTVENAEIPNENGQSNFGGIGNSFTKDDGNGAIMVFVDDEWFWFYTEK